MPLVFTPIALSALVPPSSPSAASSDNVELGKQPVGSRVSDALAQLSNTTPTTRALFSLPAPEKAATDYFFTSPPTPTAAKQAAWPHAEPHTPTKASVSPRGPEDGYTSNSSEGSSWPHDNLESQARSPASAFQSIGNLEQLSDVLSAAIDRSERFASIRSANSVGSSVDWGEREFGDPSEDEAQRGQWFNPFHSSRAHLEETLSIASTVSESNLEACRVDELVRHGLIDARDPSELTAGMRVKLNMPNRAASNITGEAAISGNQRLNDEPSNKDAHFNTFGTPHRLNRLGSAEPI